MAGGRGGPTDGDRCDWCGAPLGDDPVALAARYVDADGDEVDADLAFCTAEHRDAWVAQHRPSATSAYEDGDAPWRRGPGGPGERAARSATAKVVGVIAVAMVLFVLVCWGIGRLLA